MGNEELYKALQEHVEEAGAIKALAESEKRHLTKAEAEKIDAHLTEADRLENEIELRDRVEKNEKRLAAKMAEPEGRLSTPNHPEQNKPDADVDDAETRRIPRIPAEAADMTYRARNGFRSFGEFAQAVRRASDTSIRQFDPRLEQRAATTFGNETTGADGGFAVPPDFAAQIKTLISGESSLMARCDQMTSTSNSMTIPIDDDSPWSTSGIVAAWEGEGDSYADKKPLLKQATVRLNKLGVVVPVTEELLEDAASMASYIPRKAAEKIGFKIDFAILQGGGMGQPLGIANAACIKTVAKESAPAQSADTIVYRNIKNMWNALYAPSRANAVWVANQDCEPQFEAMFWADTYTTPTYVRPVYLPAGDNISNRGQATLYGLPVIYHQACETLGDLNDIFLCDFSQYLLITKGGGIRSDVSIHMYFAQDITAFKFRIRIGGQPWWPTTVAARDGSATYSPFVNLAVRA